MNECLYEWFDVLSNKSKFIKWNKDGRANTHFSHPYYHTQPGTHAEMEIKVLVSSINEEKNHQIEGNKVVARDKWLQANDLSLLIFTVFLLFFFIFFSPFNHLFNLQPSSTFPFPFPFEANNSFFFCFSSFWCLEYIQDFFFSSSFFVIFLFETVIHFARNERSCKIKYAIAEL